MEGARQFHSSDMPLLSRLEHLDFIMKRLEGKQNQSSWGGHNSVSGAEGQPVPLDTAVKEAYFKGTLLDRVAALENRLFQLCLELESSSTSGNFSQNSGYASSSQGSKSEPSSSLPTFNNPRQGLKEVPPVDDKRTEVQEITNRVEQGRNHPNHAKQKCNKDRVGGGDEQTCKSDGKRNRKKRTPPKWPHLRILGC